MENPFPLEFSLFSVINADEIIQYDNNILRRRQRRKPANKFKPHSQSLKEAAAVTNRGRDLLRLTRNPRRVFSSSQNVPAYEIYQFTYRRSSTHSTRPTQLASLVVAV